MVKASHHMVSNPPGGYTMLVLILVERFIGQQWTLTGSLIPWIELTQYHSYW
jgi:hypothetical protein